MIANKESKPQASKSRPDAEGEADRLLPLVGQPMTRAEKWIRSENCLSEASFFASHFTVRGSGNPEGAGT